MEPGEPSGGCGSGGTLSHSRTICSSIAFGLGRDADSFELCCNFVKHGGETGAVGGGGCFMALIAGAAHAGVKEVAYGFVVGESFEGHFGASSARGLDFDAGEAEPALDGVRAKVDVLNAR